LEVLVLVAFLVGIGVGSWAAWVSLQSLLQARALYRVPPPGMGLPEGPGPAALRGDVTVLAPIRGRGAGFLWYRETEQEYRRRGKNSGWKTVGDTQYVASFKVETGGGAFHVQDFPSETQGVESTIDYADRAWLGLFHTGGDRRTVRRWLRIPPRLTVVGRLERHGDEARLVKDNKLGLLFSPHEPRRAARIELAKGVAGLLAVTAAVVAGLWIYYENRR
jgi:hypothetical protein